ncbi:MAG TPA: ABC transporter permease [Thermodesulfobacteriota bacterium]|nr:ABC transporter permease [Thermodesulfobacteriota bacterium]
MYKLELPENKDIPGLSIPKTLPHFNIRPSHGWVSLKLKDIWEYRELLYFLVWRDIKVRYKQTVLGVAWAILQPILTMVVFSIFFGRLAKVPSDGIPYPLFAYSALVPWQLFANALTASGNSLVANQQLLTKVYFPRLVIPMSAVLAGLIDFGVSFLVLIGMMFYFGVVPTVAVLTLPLLIMLAIASALAVGLWLSALNVQYRDVQYTIPFLMQFWLFLTPIAYPSSLVPEKWRILYGLNPMAGVVEGFRWALLGKTNGIGSLIFVSALVVAILLFGGLVYFRRMERTFADVV